MPANWDNHTDRINAVRARLSEAGLAGLVVPMTDAYQSEYIPDCERRIAWLSGFTGSAGTLVILAEDAALFVDGRYTLQASMQLDADHVTPRHSVNEPMGPWLASKLAEGDRLGYDPRLHTLPWVEETQKALEPVGATLAAVDDNPVDAVWDDRPDPPRAPAVPHPVDYAGQPAMEKIQAVVDGLAKGKAAGVVIGAPDSVCWLLNMRGGDVENTPLVLAQAIVAANGRVDLFVEPAKVTDALAAQLPQCVTVRVPAEMGQALIDLAGDGARVELDPQVVNAWIGETLESAGAKIVRRQDPCELPKATKNQTELAGIRAAHLRDGVAMARFLCWIDTVVASGSTSEMAAAKHLHELRADDPLFRQDSFEAISASGPNAAIAHYRVTADSDRVLQRGELYLIDSGGQYLDGTTDITRTIAIGTPSAEMRDCFTRVLQGHMALAAVRFPKGTTGPQLDVLARQFLWRQGLDYDHGTGHGVGAYLGVHEGPQRIGKTANAAELQPGMVTSNEPGYYRAGAFGIRIENLVAVDDGAQLAEGDRTFYGFETLTLAPIDRRLINADLLSAAEIGWIDAYHARVWQEISPLVPDDVRAWLKQAVQPLGQPQDQTPAQPQGQPQAAG